VSLKIDKSKDHGFPKDEDAWLRAVLDMISVALNERQGLEAQWARNIAYYFGFQHLLYDPMTRYIQVDIGRSDAYIINRISSFVEQRVAKLSRSKPTLAVIPDKTDPVTIKAADISEKLLRHLWKVNDKDEKLEDAILFAVLSGSAFKKVLWDSEAGDGIRDDLDEDGNITFSEDGRMQSHVYHMGEITNAVRDCFQILVPPGVRKLEKSEWVTDRQAMNVEEIRAKHKDFNIDKALKSPTVNTRFEKFVASLGINAPYGYGGSGFAGVERSGNRSGCKDFETMVVNEMWLKPNSVYKDGIQIAVCGNQLLLFDKWPFDHKKYPFIKIDEHTNPYGFYGISTVSRLIPIQRHYNESRTQIAKNKRLMANGKWWAPLGSGLSEESLTDEEGEVVQSNGNMARPEQMAIAPLPNYVIQDLQQDVLDIRDVGGERSVDQQPFSGLTAGVAIETMAELADIGLGPSIKNIERGCINEGKIELLFANEFYTDQRTIGVIGDHIGELSQLIFKNTDLAYQTDVTLQMEAGFGQSKSGVRQTLINFWDRRIVYDPDTFLKAYATGNIDVLLRQKDPAMAVVLEDIELMKQGGQPPVSPFDNHVVYIRVLSEFIQTPEFRRLSPNIQMMFSQVLQAHLQAMQPVQEPEQNQAAVNTPYGQQVTVGEGS